MAPQTALVRLAAPLALLAIVAGCSGDARLKTLSVGIPKDSVMKLMGVEKPQHLDPYLYGGHFIEALYYGKPGQATPTPDRKLVPLVVIDGKLAAWGWTQWDSIAAANHIVVSKE